MSPGTAWLHTPAPCNTDKILNWIFDWISIKHKWLNWTDASSDDGGGCCVFHMCESINDWVGHNGIIVNSQCKQLMVIGSTRNTKFTSDMRQLRSQDVCLNIYVVRWTLATTIAELQLVWPPYMFIFSQFTLIVYKHITLMHWSSNHHNLLPARETTIRNHSVWHFRIYQCCEMSARLLVYFHMWNLIHLNPETKKEFLPSFSLLHLLCYFIFTSICLPHHLNIQQLFSKHCVSVKIRIFVALFLDLIMCQIIWGDILVIEMRFSEAAARSRKFTLGAPLILIKKYILLFLAQNKYNKNICDWNQKNTLDSAMYS